MGANHSHTKYAKTLCETPPTTNKHRLLFDPRSPSDEISRTPIQIDSQVPAPALKLYNHVMPYIVGPDINIPQDTGETHQRVEHNEEQENEPKRSSGVEPTLDPTKVLTALVENNDGQLPPYQL